ncbi:MAG: hypothetical protein LUH23_09415 [Oscillospiraceae bacterium]|nr:hypothetical protein [Oscillospiraceae bacterium]
MFEEIFRKKIIIPERLIEYGFADNGGDYLYCTGIMDGEFSLQVTIGENGSVDTCLTETDTGEEFTLYKTNAAGSYIGDVRCAISDVLTDISLKCCRPSVFKSAQTLRLLSHVTETYGDEPEFLWEKYDDYAVLRRKDTAKWYAVIMTIPKSKLRLPSEDMAEIIDLHVRSENMGELLGREHYYPWLAYEQEKLVHRYLR